MQWKDAAWSGISSVVLTEIAEYIMTGNVSYWPQIASILIGVTGGPFHYFVVWPRIYQIFQSRKKQIAPAADKTPERFLTPLDHRILDKIVEMDRDGDPMTAHSVWASLTDDPVDKICARLIVLEKEDYIVSDEFDTITSPCEGAIHGLTEKGLHAHQAHQHR